MRSVARRPEIRASPKRPAWDLSKRCAIEKRKDPDLLRVLTAFGDGDLGPVEDAAL